MIRAKFICKSATPMEGDQTSVKFSPVVSGSEENKSFSRWTPAGSCELVISNETPAATAFEVGQEYYLDFTKAE